LALLALAVHVYASGGYGYFRDELYFIVCGEHLAWGYVDQPPLIPLIAWTMHSLLPNSLLALRLVPALAHAGTIALIAETARLLTGGRWSQALAGLSVLVGGVFLAQGTILMTDAFQPLTWLFCSYAIIRVIREGDERWWLAIGVVAGLALLSKYMIAFWLLALAVGLLATPARRCLAHPKLYLGAAIAMLIVLPNVLWQYTHDWPFLEIARVAATRKNVALSPLDFMLDEIQFLNAVTAPVWLVGLGALAFSRRFADLRGFAVSFVVLMVVMVTIHAKPYYPVGAYPLLFAAGAVAIEAWFVSTMIRTATITIVALVGMIAAPLTLPVLPIESLLRYQAMIRQTPKPMDNSPVGKLSQYYADMFGWPELAAQVGRIYQTLPPEEQARAVFLGTNYGEAAAIDVFGNPWHLPAAISGHNNYFLWGPRGHDGSVVIRLGGERENLLKAYATVQAAGVFENPWAMPSETGRTIWICRGRKPPLDTAWPSFKNYS
jgi:hypothetical protein